MKDRIFEGRDVARALEAASLGLGVPVARLRYVVLEQGRLETASAAPAPARVAVLLDALLSGATRPPDASPAPAAERADVKTRLARLVAAVAEAAGEPLEVAFEEGADSLVARLRGPGEAMLLENGGAPLRALEHLMQRAVADDEPRRLLLSSQRYRSERDGRLREKARQLADAVRRDGSQRETEPLNSYDRRIVHLAVQDEPGVRSFGVGEGAARRVAVAPAGDGDTTGDR